MNYFQAFEFSFDRLTFNERLSNCKQSKIKLFTNHPRMLQDLIRVKSKLLGEKLALFKYEHGLNDAIEVEFVQDDGKEISRLLDGFVKEIKDVNVITTKYSIPVVQVKVRLC